MQFDLKSAVSHWKELKDTICTIGLVTKTDFKLEDIHGVIKEVQELFPQLTDFKLEDDEKTYLLKNEKTMVERRMLFKIDKFRIINLAWDIQVDFPDKELIRKLFKIIEEKSDIEPLFLEYIDFKFATYSYKNVNHYNVIRDTFFNSSPLKTFFDGYRIFNNDVSGKAYIDYIRACAISIASNVSSEEVLQNVYQRDTLIAQIGVVQTRGFTEPDFNLSENVIENIEIASEIISKKFIPYVLNPLDENLFKEKAEE
ncbi:MAG: hypothetical protein HQ591_04920 [candidate division Zixibacteria bacterium]|nr:hypothetical protein [Candidatus Tariuqbacter arcticus]